MNKTRVLKANEITSESAQAKSILFDVSGTLVDDLKSTWSIVCDILEHYGKPPVSLSEFQELFHLPFWKFFAALGIENVSPNEFIRFYQELFPSYADNISIFAEVRQFLEECSSFYARIGIVSQTPKQQVSYYLDRFRLDEFFQTIIALDDITEPKPSPLSLLVAAESMSASLNKLIYIGDMTEDILAARYARIYPVAIYRQFGSYNTKMRLLSAKPWMLISSLEEIFHIAN